MLSEQLATGLFGALSNWSSSMGWGEIPDIETRAVQMRIFVLGLVVTIALRFAPKGLLPEYIKRRD
jgi:branched-chain amino acid transport system permease protein